MQFIRLREQDENIGVLPFLLNAPLFMSDARVTSALHPCKAKEKKLTENHDLKV